MSHSQIDRSGLGECADQVLGGFSGRPTDQRYQNQGCSLICTKMPVLKDEICCWVYTMNPSDLHCSMDMRVRSGTPAMCMAMTPPERRECVPTSFGANTSMAAPTQRVSDLRTEMMFEALNERSP